MLSNSYLDVLSKDLSNLIAARQLLIEAGARTKAKELDFDIYQRLRGLEAFELWC